MTGHTFMKKSSTKEARAYHTFPTCFTSGAFGGRWPLLGARFPVERPSLQPGEPPIGPPGSWEWTNPLTRSGARTRALSTSFPTTPLVETIGPHTIPLPAVRPVNCKKQSELSSAHRCCAGSFPPTLQRLFSTSLRLVFAACFWARQKAWWGELPAYHTRPVF